MLRDAPQNLSMALNWSGSSFDGAVAAKSAPQGYSEDDIKNGFRIDIGFPKAAFGDRVKMLLSAVTAVLIPLAVLVALSIGVSGAVQSTLGALTQQSEQLPYWLMLDLALVFLGASLARRLLRKSNDKCQVTVTAVEQPELHAFINHIASLLQGPAPKAVKLDAEVGLVLRPKSLQDAITGNGPEVIIGLPLLYGLSARQLSGVIAHAYAGYSREARLYGYPILCAVDRWLFAHTAAAPAQERVRTAFSAKGKSWLDSLLSPFDALVQWLFNITYGAVSALTFQVSRKVDMAGDIYSARIAGSTEFRSTQFRLRSLHYGQQHAIRELVNSWKHKSLTDNFPALVVGHADTLQLSLRPRLVQEMEELVTPLTRSRIVDLGRIVQVEQTQEEGACYLLGAAISLLRDVPALARTVTLNQYQYLGIEQADNYATSHARASFKGESESSSVHDFYLGLERSSRVVKIDDFHALNAIPVATRVQEYTDLLHHFYTRQAELTELAEAVRNFEFRKNLVHTRKVLEAWRGKPAEVTRDLEVQWLALIKDQSDLKIELNGFEHKFARRAALAFSLALALASAPEKSTERAELELRLWHIADGLNSLHRSMESILRLRSYSQVLGQLLVETDQDQSPEIEALCARFQNYQVIELNALMKVFSAVPYPLSVAAISADNDFVPGDILSLAAVIQADVADTDSITSCPVACHRVTNAVCHYLENLNLQLMQRVVRILATVEKSYGIEATSEPR